MALRAASCGRSASQQQRARDHLARAATHLAAARPLRAATPARLQLQCVELSCSASRRAAQGAALHHGRHRVPSRRGTAPTTAAPRRAPPPPRRRLTLAAALAALAAGAFASVLSSSSSSLPPRLRLRLRVWRLLLRCRGGPCGGGGGGGGGGPANYGAERCTAMERTGRPPALRLRSAARLSARPRGHWPRCRPAPPLRASAPRRGVLQRWQLAPRQRRRRRAAESGTSPLTPPGGERGGPSIGGTVAAAGTACDEQRRDPETRPAAGGAGASRGGGGPRAACTRPRRVHRPGPPELESIATELPPPSPRSDHRLPCRHRARRPDAPKPAGAADLVQEDPTTFLEPVTSRPPQPRARPPPGATRALGGG